MFTLSKYSEHVSVTFFLDGQETDRHYFVVLSSLSAIVSQMNHTTFLEDKRKADRTCA